MKYLKTYESTDFTKENSEILNTIDILTSFVEELVELKLVEGGYITPGQTTTPVQVYARCSGQRYDLITFAKYVNENIDKNISTIEWSLSGSSKSNIDDRELDLLCDEFVNKLKEFSPNCRINNFRKTVEKNSNVSYNKIGYPVWKTKTNATVKLSMVDSNKTRYKHLFI